MKRNYLVTTKPEPRVSFGGSVSIARQYKSYEEFLDKVIKFIGWTKSTRAS